ncbi:HNH endonuclease [Methylorubrum populi]|uniref:HNH endonuclease n=1 Tax=Methylorubrum populi TaxID=223967 RepID=UPI000DB2F8F5|nr:HNH endonuclease [Methylorubrum populi]PZP71746.1 MAG: hypothetical protein DI590_05645 [Methylorubrum populi]
MAERPTIERLRELLSYNPNTGVLTWRVSPMWAVAAGDIAGGLMTNGYRHVRVSGQLIPAQDIAFALFYGRWPTVILDHRDRDRGNNRISNLVEAGSSGNNRNRLRTSRSGFRGVVQRGRLFVAQCSVDNRTRRIGSHSTAEDAARAYDAFVLTNFGDRFPTNASLGLLK